MGRYAEATELLTLAQKAAVPDPLVAYHLAHFSQQTGDAAQALAYAQQGAATPLATFFANRLADIAALQLATDLNPADAHAPYLLGNLWYDKRQYDEAIAAWELAAFRNPTFPTAWRNLGLAYFNKRHAPEKALECYEKAFALDPTDARVLMELTQLYRRLNSPAADQLALLEAHPALVEFRDDLYLEHAALHNQLGQPERAYELLLTRQFHPWEGGEGKVSGEYLRSLTELAKQALHAGQPGTAVARLTRALAPNYPPNLGEGKLPGAPENELHYWLGCAYAALGQPEAAQTAWQHATAGRSEPAAALFYNDAPPDQIFYQGLAWRQLGNEARSEAIFDRLLAYGQQHLADDVKLDYFAVSLPDLLVFEDDLSRRNALHCRYLMGLGYLGLGQLPEAETALTAVLAQDQRHPGAQVHLQLLRQPTTLLSA